MLSPIIRRTMHALGGLAAPFLSLANRRARQRIRTLAVPGRHVFFGYYDITPFSPDSRKLLAVSTGHGLEPPTPESMVDIGFFDLTNDPPRFTRLASSNAWCWQQGCRLQWLPKTGQSSNLIFFNDRVGDSYVGVAFDIVAKQEVARTPVALYDIARDGSLGLSLNFSRLQRLRPGYGYTSLEDRTADEARPLNDGIYLYRFGDDQAELLLSFADINRMCPLPSNICGDEYINHLSFSPKADKCIFLHIVNKGRRRYTRLMAYSLYEKNLHAYNSDGTMSHFCWVGDDQILVYCQLSDSDSIGYKMIDLSTGDARAVGSETLVRDGHPTMIGQGAAILTDTYPDRFGYQSLMIYAIGQKKKIFQLHIWRSAKFNREVRVDLHPRINQQETAICIDDEFDGYRAIKLIELDKNVR